MGNSSNCHSCCGDKDKHTAHVDLKDSKMAAPPMSSPPVGRGSKESDPDAVSKAHLSYEQYRQGREQFPQGPENDSRLENRMEELPDGSRFEGQFSGKYRHGWGKFVWATGGCYEGQFYNNDMHGEGTYRWSDGSTYIGSWQNNNLGPSGMMKWTDGRVYQGQFVNGKKHGEGRLSWPDGRWYSGQWEAGKQHGVGITCTGKGPGTKSQWEHGTLVRWLEANS